MRRNHLLIVCCLVAGLVFTNCHKRLPPKTSPYALIGEALPEIRVKSLDGHRHALKAPDKGPAVLALWATWCGPCRQEVPALMQWLSAHGGISLLALNVDSAAPDLQHVRDVAQSMGLDEPVYVSSPAEASPLGLRAVPVLYFIDADGVVRAVHEGFEGVADLKRWLAKAADSIRR